jgi:hypothetical protein
MNDESRNQISEEYRKCAEICRTTDYSDPHSVHAHNRSVKRMYLLVKRENEKGEEAIESLARLLDESKTREWLSFQLLEVADNLKPNIESKCLALIRSIAHDNQRPVDSFAARIWLAKWEQKKNRKE